MNNPSDWMELYNIKSPEKYFLGNGGVFGRSSMEHSIHFDYGRSRRRPKLWNRIKSEPQMFGPNIIFSVGNGSKIEGESTLAEFFPMSATFLQGAGTVEQVLTNIVNGSHYMFLKHVTEDPLELNFIVTRKVLSEVHENLLRRSLVNFQKTSFDVENELQRYCINFEIRQCKLTFWFGFDVSSNSTETVKNFLKKETHF